MGEIEDRAFLKSLTKYEPDQTLPLAAIVDVDGTVALPGDDPLDLKNYKPNTPVVHAVQALYMKGYKIIVLTARPQSLYNVTFNWFIRYVCPFSDLLMAPDGTGAAPRKKAQAKYDLFISSVKNRYYVDLVLDNEAKVVDMWRAIGLICLDPDGN